MKDFTERVFFRQDHQPVHVLRVVSNEDGQRVLFTRALGRRICDLTLTRFLKKHNEAFAKHKEALR